MRKKLEAKITKKGKAVTAWQILRTHLKHLMKYLWTSMKFLLALVATITFNSGWAQNEKGSVAGVLLDDAKKTFVGSEYFSHQFTRFGKTNSTNCK